MNKENVIGGLNEMSVEQDVLFLYEKGIEKKRWMLLITFLLLLLVCLFAITIGPLEMTMNEAYQVVAHHLLPSLIETPSAIIDGIVWSVRVPRVLTGLLVGFGLAISGAVMQPVLRNPMATPFTLGISSAAGFGAALVITFGKNFSIGSSSLVISAFAFSSLVVLIIVFISKWKNATSEIIILTGIAMSYLFNAGIRLLQYVVDPILTKEMVFWLSGSLYKGNWENLLFIFISVVVLSSVLIIKSKDLNAISVNDEVAKSVGIDAEKTRLTLMVVASLLTAVLVSFTGTIGFIGLIAPHIARMILGSDNMFVVIGSGMIGALLVVVSDILALNIIAPTVLPIGVITAFMGVPLFLYLIFKMKRG